MELARNAENGEVYDAVSFDRRSDRDRLRHSLVCLECGADAYFSRSARNGRSASFGARPHRPDCKHHDSSETIAKTFANLPEAEIREPLEGEFQLRRVDDKHSGVHLEHDDTAPRPPRGRARRHTRTGGAARSLPSRGLRVLLAKLLTEPPTRSSTDVLHLYDGTTMLIRDACVHADDVTVQLRNKRRVYWGTIRDARFSSGTYWINTGRAAQPSIVIAPDELAQLLRRLKLEHADDLAGAAFIIWGPLRLSESSGKLLIFADDLGLLDVLVPK